MTKTFPIENVQRLRRHAAKASQAPQSCPNGWSKSTVDPMMVLAVFEPLRLKDGFILRAYQFREGGNGNGFVWAMPVDSEFPHPKECPILADLFLEPPKPPAALDDYMEAIDGDGTAWSYLCASLLGRQLAEFGAMWHGCDWGTHTILGADPWREGRPEEEERLMRAESDWQWEESKPKRWNPLVSESSNAAKVTFFTHSGYDQEAIYRHIDTYQPGVYRFTSQRRQIATGPGGYVF